MTMPPNPIQEKNIETLSTINNTLKPKKIIQKINDLKIQIIFPKELISNKNAVNCCYMLLNILPRFLKNVSYNGPDMIIKKFPKSHHEKISIDQIQNPTLTIVLGTKKYDNGKNILYIGSAGWSIYASTIKPCHWSSSSDNSLSAFYLAGIITGEIFKYLLPSIPTDKIPSHFEYDLITYGSESQPVLEPQIPSMINLDNFAIVGCGAIGQAFALALQFATNITGKIILIDPDNVDLSNIQRYVYSFVENINEPKTNILAKLLSKDNPTLNPIPITLSYELVNITGTSFKEVVTAVDNIETRLNVQAGLPKTIWNAWTDTSNNTLRYGVGHHIMNGKYQCLACSYYPKSNSPSESKLHSMMTGISEIRINQNANVNEEDIIQIEKHTKIKQDNLRQHIGKPIDILLHGPCGMYTLPINVPHEPTPAPHTPFLAGVFLATQIILSRIASLPDKFKLLESSAEFSALHIPNQDCILKHKKNENCFCNDNIYRNVYDKKWN
ncbi:MAG: hypothetical protein K8823_379 [Cenarchaeum symbiont of Oopsacas minuta]|nr:hypothetical protein [Cenarchaeum symbiont of Oopsacas minuta]